MAAPLHGDLRLTNIVVSDGAFIAIDAPENGRFAVAGVDAISLVGDMLGLRTGAKAYDLERAEAGFVRLVREAHFVSFLRGALGARELESVRALIVLAVLRDVAHKGSVPGAEHFIEMCSAGWFDGSLRPLVVGDKSG